LLHLGLHSSFIFHTQTLAVQLSTYPHHSTNTLFFKMPAAHQEALKATLESKGLKFHLRAGNAKWECTVLDRSTQ
jgi:predicted component of type VI protein secretion system